VSTLLVRSAERESAVGIRSPTTVRAQIKVGCAMAPVRLFSRSGSSSPDGWHACSSQVAAVHQRPINERQDPEQSEAAHKECVRVERILARQYDRLWIS
jgi:hypothetical protein